MKNLNKLVNDFQQLIEDSSFQKGRFKLRFCPNRYDENTPYYFSLDIDGQTMILRLEDLKVLKSFLIETNLEEDYD